MWFQSINCRCLKIQGSWQHTRNYMNSATIDILSRMNLVPMVLARCFQPHLGNTWKHNMFDRVRVDMLWTGLGRVPESPFQSVMWISYPSGRGLDANWIQCNEVCSECREPLHLYVPHKSEERSPGYRDGKVEGWLEWLDLGPSYRGNTVVCVQPMWWHF